MPECSICNGQGMCWDCSWDEGIDIDSLTPAAQSKKLFEASQARIMIELPEASGVTLMNQKMSMPGARRTYVIPIPDQAKNYRYEVRVDVVLDGKKYFKKHVIEEFRAGMILALAVSVPAVPEGEAPQILVNSKTLAAGGAPPEDGGEKNVTAYEYEPAF